MTEMTESMAVEWEKWLGLERTNVETLEKRIESFSSNHDSPEGFRYREFWAEAKEVADMFETITPLPRDEKERLQERYEGICGEVKRKQAQERKKQEQEWQARRAQSKQERGLIEGKINEALSAAESTPEDIPALSKAQLVLKEALALLKGNAEGTVPADESKAKEAAQNSSKLLRDDRQECWQKWRMANDLVFGRKQAVWDRNYSQIQPEAKAAIDEANDGDPFQALEKVKAAQNRLKDSPLGKSQREEIKVTLHNAWDVAIAKVNAVREGKRKKHEDWLERMKTQVERWAEMIQKNKDEASELEEQVKRLQLEMRADRSPDYKDTVRNLIGEKRQKIEEIKAANKDLEEKIQSAKEKLTGEVVLKQPVEQVAKQ